MQANKPYLVYPGRCAKCGKRWGDHLTEQAIRENGGGCKFHPLPGEISKPTLVNPEDESHE